MDKKGFELAISTIVLLVIGLAVLIALILLLQRGIGGFNSGTEPFLENAEASAVKSACQLACNTENSFTYCCGNFTVSNEEIRCDDSRLGVSCSKLNCAAVSCLAG